MKKLNSLLLLLFLMTASFSVRADLGMQDDNDVDCTAINSGSGETVPEGTAASGSGESSSTGR